MSPKVPVYEQLSWDRKFDKEVLDKIKELLERKHLYQHVTLDISGIKKEIMTLKHPAREATLYGDDYVSPDNMDERRRLDVMKSFNKRINFPWEFGTESTPPDWQPVLISQGIDSLKFILPTIKITCNHCESVLPPHNSGFIGLAENLPDLNFTDSHSSEGGVKQLFFFPYQCQSCKGEPLIFMVHRDDLKLKLVGRSQFEQVDVPKFLKKESKWYREAVIAFNCGRTLAGLFYLRTMVEQYWRRVLSVQERIPGEDLGDMYADLLDDEFPQRYTSLKKVYEELSEKIHEAEDDEKQFEKSKADIEKHFDLLQHFPLKKNDT